MEVKLSHFETAFAQDPFYGIAIFMAVVFFILNLHGQWLLYLTKDGRELQDLAKNVQKKFKLRSQLGVLLTSMVNL